MRRQLRPTSPSGLLLIANGVFIIVNILFFLNNAKSWSQSFSTEKKGGPSTGEGEDGGGGGGGDFISQLMKQKSDLRRQVLAAENQLEEMKRQRQEFQSKLLKCNRRSKEEYGGDATVDENKKHAKATPCPPSSKGEKKHQTVMTTADEDIPPYLVIGIPTVPRKREEGVPFKKSLLFRTLDSMVTEIRGTAFEPQLGNSFLEDGGARLELETISETMSPKGSGVGGVRIVVVNNRPGDDHVMFHSAAEYFKQEKKIHFIDFIERKEAHEDNPKKPFAPEFLGSNKEKPTDKVRRQTLDVISMLDEVVGKSKYFYFTEDDFEFCGSTLTALHYMINKANFYTPKPDPWTGIRCSFGLNGILMHNDPVPEGHLNAGDGEDENEGRQSRKRKSGKALLAAGAEFNRKHGVYPDLTYFRDYLMEHFNRRPPDHLVVEWYAKESQQSKRYFGSDRRVMAFRYNVARHTGGRQSTLRVEEAWSFPGCFTELIAPQVFDVEAWNPVECQDDDLWPCPTSLGGNGEAFLADDEFKRFQKKHPAGSSVYRGQPILWNAKDEAAVSKRRKIFMHGKEVRKEKM